MVSGAVSLVAKFKILPALPVAILTVLLLLPTPKLTVPVVPESRFNAPVVPVVKERLLAAPVVIAPPPVKPKEVDDTAIVSREVTEERAPELITIPLMVFEEVGADMASKVCKAPVESK